MGQFNSRIRQVILLGVILMMGFLIVKELYGFLPGFLGAVTFYIISRGQYFNLTEKKHWNKSLTALLFILTFLMLIGLPMFYAVKLVTPKVNSVFSHSHELMAGLNHIADKVKELTGVELNTSENITKVETGAASFIPTFLDSTANILANLLVMFFVLFFMLVGGRSMEETISGYLPLNDEGKDLLAKETMQMVRGNALGIPLISIIQGITAMIGYLIFGLKDWGMWGFLTGVFAFFPIVGTMLIWLPLVIFLYSKGMNWQGTGLLIYSLAVTGNVDYLARVTLMKKIGDVHPLITIFGVIVGLKLFGFMGFIFGPLVFSYLIILIKIYTHEFVEPTTESGSSMND
jgi:predicted PurR-regulated permease PerM